MIFKYKGETVGGTSSSNLIQELLDKKQDKLTGTKGQVVGFDVQGNAVAQESPDNGVTSFNGRIGAVVPQAGDYTAEQVGAATQAYADNVASESFKNAESIFAPKASPVFTGSISLGRKSGTTVGAGSVAIGNDCTASATASCAEGWIVSATGEGSHAEGANTTASGDFSHAEGVSTKATGDYSHSEGSGCTSSASCSHAEGQNCKSSGDSSHSEGMSTNAVGQTSHAEGNNCLANGQSSHAEGFISYAYNQASHAEGRNCVADRTSHAEGVCSCAGGTILFSKNCTNNVFTIDKSNSSSFIADSLIGKDVIIIYINSQSIQKTSITQATSNTITVSNSLYSGSNPYTLFVPEFSYVPAYQAHAEGKGCIANGSYSHAEGLWTIARGLYSHTSGYNTQAQEQYQTVIGSCNATGLSGKFIVGKGSDAARANSFRVYDTGVFASGNYNASGADYAELFEWLDGNHSHEDRAGRFVTLDGEKIRLATPQDDFILGIVSGNPSVVGDVYDDQWQGMYLSDIFGRPIWEDVEVPDEFEEFPDPENPEKTIRQIISPAHTEHHQMLNPAYNSGEPYLPRSQRPEWDAVGMLGKLVAVDDGTCQVNGWCAVGEDGVATASNACTRYRVMSRLDENHIRVLILN